MANIDVVIKLCIPEDHQELTLSAIRHYLIVDDILSHQRFQDEADLFMMEWLSLYVNAGINNYIHMFKNTRGGTWRNMEICTISFNKDPKV
jgi:hypothetical protein